MTFISSTARSSSSLKFSQPFGSLKPAWLYELLPLIYIAVGTTASVVVGGVLAISSGVIFICTGIHVLRMRRHYRLATMRRFNVPPHIGR